MKTFKRSDSHLFCGHWNGSPVEVGQLTRLLKAVPERECCHHHPYHEYYLLLEGRARLNVEGRSVAMEAGELVMVEPGEAHHVEWVDPKCGVRWVIIKERSEPYSKQVVDGGNRS